MNQIRAARVVAMEALYKSAHEKKWVTVTNPN
jgi:hypothetical protein